MILVDVSLLVEATMVTSARHDAAREWLRAQLVGTARVGLPWASITGFIRVVSQPKAWDRPMPMHNATTIARSWLQRPCAWIPQPGPQHAELFAKLLDAAPYSRVVTDAHLAAIAVEHGLELCSRDRDFARWAHLGLRSTDPLAG